MRSSTLLGSSLSVLSNKQTSSRNVITQGVHPIAATMLSIFRAIPKRLLSWQIAEHSSTGRLLSFTSAVQDNLQALIQTSSSSPESIPSTSGRSSALSPHPPTTGSGPLTVRYPFPIEYYKDRESLVYSLQRSPVSIHHLPGDVFNVPVRVDILHRVVRYLRAMWRQGTHKAKSRAEVRGGGKKPWPQKGTGKARQGSIRSPLWRGGGVSHGPIPRSHAHKLNLKVQLLGMKCALSAKYNEKRLLVVDSLVPSTPKTKVMEESLHQLLKGIQGSTALLVDSGPRGADGGALLRRATGNLPWVQVMSAKDVTVYHILKSAALVLTREAAEQLVQRVANPAAVRNPRVHAWWLQQQVAVKEALEELMKGEAQRAQQLSQ